MQLWIRGLLNVTNSDRRVAQEFSNVEVYIFYIMTHSFAYTITKY